MINLWKRFQCWRKHDFRYLGGHWVLPEKFAITKRGCARCGLYQECGQDHVNGMQTLEKETFMTPSEVIDQDQLKGFR